MVVGAGEARRGLSAPLLIGATLVGTTVTGRQAGIVRRGIHQGSAAGAFSGRAIDQRWRPRDG